MDPHVRQLQSGAISLNSSHLSHSWKPEETWVNPGGGEWSYLSLPEDQISPVLLNSLRQHRNH